MAEHTQQQLFDQIVSGFVESESERVRDAVLQSLADGVNAQVILDDGLKRGVDNLGELFERQIVFLPQIMFGAKIFANAMDILRPHLAAGAIYTISGKTSFPSCFRSRDSK
jgi:5-methyltetrahydrofolate--homocysteine methyltransferase